MSTANEIPSITDAERLQYNGAKKLKATEQLLSGKMNDLVNAKAALSAFRPVGYGQHIPPNVVSMAVSGLRGRFGLLKTIPIVVGAGTGGFFWNKHKFKQKLADELTKLASVECIHVGGSLTKHASNGLQEARSIMRRIYEEDPSYWPYGLSPEGHESVYLIRDNMTKVAAGFVGWQEILEGNKLVGSYSIGILPEYREKKFAKEAVAKVLLEKSAGVDEVRSYVCSHNMKSKGLAKSLGVNVFESF